MLNERGRAILNYIRCFQRDKGYPPTIREIGEKFQIASTNGVRYHLNILQKEGHLSRRSRISRGTTTVTEGIPVLGRVAAGRPLLAEESYEGTLEPGTVFGDTAGLFALRVKGESAEEIAGCAEAMRDLVPARATAGRVLAKARQHLWRGEAAFLRDGFNQIRRDDIDFITAL